MGRLVILLAALGLCACASSALDRQLDGMVGQDVRVLMGKLGRPAEAQPTVNGPTYDWVGASVSQGDPSGPPAGRRCRVEAKTDRQNLIYAIKVSGNRTACAAFAAALTRR